MCGRGEGMRGGSEKCKNQMSKGEMREAWFALRTEF